ncbi:uncharacterized protein UTRI_02194 [Ustilago trichophora]|uniref:Uncharacterized protein n=1 Tax=Ustilago trichophora TaxID=86804 RepID=A0A5C3DZH7_9BASI|nr:uncharacterized protein UTRI_02194 [Ustilago trichophora]
MLWQNLLVCFLTLLAIGLAAETGAAPASLPAGADRSKNPDLAKPKPASGSTDTSTTPGGTASPAPASTGGGGTSSSGGGSGGDGGGGGGGGGGGTQKPSESVFGAGCRWDPTTSNIEEVTFQFRTGQAPPSTWFSDLNDAETTSTTSSAAAADTKALLRRDNEAEAPPAQPGSKLTSPEHGGNHHLEEPNDLLDPSYHTRLIDVLTFRARYGSFGSSLNSAGCALPAFSERLAQLEEQERELVNNYTRLHKPIAGKDSKPEAMFFWAGLTAYNRKVKSDLIQTVVFYGDGCAANPRQGLCVYAAEYSDFRYNPEDHMCMGSNMPVFYPIDTEMTVVYRTQNGFRTQESWIDGKMISYLRSAGDQIMNSFVITQECKGCTWPLSEQVYSNIVLKFSEPEPHFDALGLCSGGATTTMPRMMEGGRVWVIDKVVVPSGKHVTSTPGDSSGDTSGDTRNAGTFSAGAGAGSGSSAGSGAGAGASKVNSAKDGDTNAKEGNGDKTGPDNPGSAGDTPITPSPGKPSPSVEKGKPAQQPDPAPGTVKPDTSQNPPAGKPAAPATAPQGPPATPAGNPAGNPADHGNPSTPVGKSKRDTVQKADRAGACGDDDGDPSAGCDNGPPPGGVPPSPGGSGGGPGESGHGGNVPNRRRRKPPVKAKRSLVSSEPVRPLVVRQDFQGPSGDHPGSHASGPDPIGGGSGGGPGEHHVGGGSDGGGGPNTRRRKPPVKAKRSLVSSEPVSPLAVRHNSDEPSTGDQGDPGSGDTSPDGSAGHDGGQLPPKQKADASAGKVKRSPDPDVDKPAACKDGYPGNASGDNGGQNSPNPGPGGSPGSNDGGQSSDGHPPPSCSPGAPGDNGSGGHPPKSKMP